MRLVDRIDLAPGRNDLSTRCTAAALLAIVAVTLSACGGGGGGGGDHDLAIRFSYVGQTADLYSPVTATPQFSGLEGNAPRCSVTAGTLPPGVAIASDCSVHGAPLQVGVYTSTVTLTVDGYGGSISTPFQFEVNAPVLTAIRTSYVVGEPNQVVQVGATLRGLPVVTLSHYTPQSGDLIQYRLRSGTLPAGLLLNASNGTLTGVPSDIGIAAATIDVSITHGATTFVADSVSVTFRSEEAPLALSYAACCTSVVGDTVSVDATSTYVPAPGTSTSFEAAGPLPPSIVLDAATGRLSGTLAAGGAYSASVRQTVFLSGQPLAQTTATFAWNVAGFAADYPNLNQQVYPNTPFSLSPTSISGMLPGDTYTFSVEPYPGSTYTGNTQSGTPVPPWLSINPSSGVIQGVGPATAPVFWQWELNVVLTVHRNGRDFRATRVFYVFLL